MHARKAGGMNHGWMMRTGHSRLESPGQFGHQSRILDSGPTLYLVQGRAKSVLHGPHSTESNLFLHKETTHTGMDECPRILLSCFRARNTGERLIDSHFEASRSFFSSVILIRRLSSFSHLFPPRLLERSALFCTGIETCHVRAFRPRPLASASPPFHDG